MLEFGFYHLDCMEGMKQFPDKYFDLCICDPPYGIGIGSTMSIGRGGYSRPFAGKYASVPPGQECCRKAKFYHAFDDSAAPDAEYFKELARVSKYMVIWGGNYFLDHLGRATCMIVWDKRRRGLSQADCEIAWTNLPGQSRIFEFKWNGMLQEDMKNKEQRIHPTQKPVALYEWILNKFAKPGDIILDTHVGSASSLIACRHTGHKYVGFEIDEYYYKIASERLKAEEQQMNIFDFMGEQEQAKITKKEGESK